MSRVTAAGPHASKCACGVLVEEAIDEGPPRRRVKVERTDKRKGGGFLMLDLDLAGGPPTIRRSSTPTRFKLHRCAPHQSFSAAAFDRKARP